MKTLLISYKFLFMTLATLPLSMCSNDDDGEAEKPFEPVTLDLSEITVQEDETSFIVNGFTFINHGSTTEINGFGDGLPIWYDGTDFHYIELKLDNVAELSKITLNIFNNAGGTAVSLWNNGVLVEENDDIPNGNKDTVMFLNGRTVDLLRITSYEGAINSIKLE